MGGLAPSKGGQGGGLVAKGCKGVGAGGGELDPVAAERLIHDP